MRTGSPVSPTARAFVVELVEVLRQEPQIRAELADALRAVDDVADGVRLQTTAAAAIRLGLSSKTVERMARCGRLPGAIKAGAVWRIPVDATPTSCTHGATGEADAPARPRRKRAVPSGAGGPSAEDAMSALLSGRMRRTTATKKSAPAPGEPGRGRGPRTGDPMDMQQSSDAPTGVASVTRITKRGADR